MMSHVDMSRLGGTFRCACGREHHVPVQEVVMSDDAMPRLGEFVVRFMGRFAAQSPASAEEPVPMVVVVADENTYRAAGEDVKNVLQGVGCIVDVLILPPGVHSGRVEADEPTVENVLARLSSSADSQGRAAFAVAVGAGTINDVVKYASFQAGRPYISVPTAPSMDGYVSPVAALLVAGFKKTLPAAPPLAVFADLDVLSQAPFELIAAGFGDLLGKLTAGADWVLGNLVNGEYYCQAAADLARTVALECLKRAADVRTRTKDAVKKLTEGLVLSGIAMLMAGNSRPASGAEHHLSHYWEMKSLREGRSEPLHGVKVGVATVLSAELYADILRRDPRRLDLPGLKRRHPTRREREARIRRFYGPMADEALAETAGKYLTWEERERRLCEVSVRWDAIREALTRVVPDSQRVRNALVEAGAPATAQAIGFDEGWVREALLNAKDLRMRFTILDLADLFGCLDEADFSNF